MAKKRLRNSKIRIKNVKTPAGRLTKRYDRKLAGKAKCSICGRILSGINYRVSKRKTNRPFGGQLCSPCTRKKMIQKAIME